MMHIRTEEFKPENYRLPRLRFLPPTTTYYFKRGDMDYKVIHAKLSNGDLRVKSYVQFVRVTRNVFGNGSTNVWQDGWRSLPLGPKRRELEREAELIALRSKLA